MVTWGSVAGCTGPSVVEGTETEPFGLHSGPEDVGVAETDSRSGVTRTPRCNPVPGSALRGGVPPGLRQDDWKGVGFEGNVEGRRVGLVTA